MVVSTTSIIHLSLSKGSLPLSLLPPAAQRYSSGGCIICGNFYLKLLKNPITSKQLNIFIFSATVCACFSIVGQKIYEPLRLLQHRLFIYEVFVEININNTGANGVTVRRNQNFIFNQIFITSRQAPLVQQLRLRPTKNLLNSYKVTIYKFFFFSLKNL